MSWQDDPILKPTVNVKGPWDEDPIVKPSIVDSGHVKSWLFPNAANIQGDGLGRSAARVGFGVADLINTPTRAFAAIRGQSMSDPNAYILRPETEAAIASSNKDLTSHPEMNNYIPPGGFSGMPMMMPVPSMSPGLIEAGGRMASDPTSPLVGMVRGLASIPKMLQNASPMLKDAILRFASLKGEGAAIERAASKTGRKELVEAAKLTPDEMAHSVNKEILGYNASEDAATAQAQSRKQEILDKTVGSPSDPYTKGKSIQETAEKGKLALGKAFQQEQDRVLSETSVSSKPLLWKNRKGFPGMDMSPDRRPLKNSLQNEVLDYLNEIQYDPVKGYGTAGNSVVQPDAINELKQIYTLTGKARTTKDALDMRRIIDQRLNFGGEGNMPLFGRGSDNELAVKTMRDRINNVIEKQFTRTIKDPAQAKDMAEAWRANNSHYANVANTLGDVSDQLNGKNAEQFLGKIQSIGADRMKALIETASKNPEIAPVVQELKTGYVDNLILKSTKDGHVDPVALRKLYASPEAQEMNKTMMTPAQRSRFEFALNKFEMTNLPENQPVGQYFRQGKDLKYTSDQLGNISNYDKRYALKELEFLDNIAGRQGKEKLGYQALAMSQARKIGMDENGSLPILPNILTGKFATGGAPGALLQSPAGAVLAFRILNKFKGAGAKNLGEITKSATGFFPSIAAREMAQQETNQNLIPFRPRQIAEDSTMNQPQAMR